MAVNTTKRGKKWQYSFECGVVDGKRLRKTKGGFRTKAEAEAAGIKAQAEYFDSGIVFTPSQMTFKELLSLWAKEYGNVNWKQDTKDNYTKYIRLYIEPELGLYKIAALDSSCLQNFITKKAFDGFSRNTLSNFKSILSCSLDFAVIKKYLKYNPMYSVKLPSPRNERIKSRTKPNVYIPADKIRILFERFQKWSSDYIALQLGYRCGLRLGEVFGLSWDDVDFANKKLTIDKQVQWNQHEREWYFTLPKYDSIRTIDIDDDFVELLAEFKQRQEKAKDLYGEYYTKLYKDENNFLNEKVGAELQMVNVRENGTYVQPRTIQHVARTVHYDLGYKDFTFHSLRHTHATMLAESGAPPKYVQERLGHKNLVVTLKRYYHLTPKMENDGSLILQKLDFKD